MSGVATLKARGVKRPLDEMAVETPASCSPARFALRATPHSFKRSRFSPPPGAAAARGSPARTSGAPAGSAAGTPAGSSGDARGELGALSREELAALARHVPRRLKRVVERLSNGQVAAGERLFTVADLREIVTSVVTEREAKLGEDFAKVLNEKLAEQFSDFSRYNEDYLARQTRGRDCSYLS